MICKYLLPFCRLVFYFLDYVICRANFLILAKSNLAVVFFYIFAFGVILKKPLSKINVMKVYSCVIF